MDKGSKKFDIGTPQWIRYLFDLMMLLMIGLSVSVIFDIGEGAVQQLQSGNITFKGILLILQPLQVMLGIFAIIWIHSIKIILNESGFRRKGLFRSFELPFTAIAKVKFKEKRGVLLQGENGNYIRLNDVNLDDSNAVHSYVAEKLNRRDDVEYEEDGGIFWHTESELKEMYAK